MRVFTQKRNPPQRGVTSNLLRANAPAFGPHRADSIPQARRAIGNQSVPEATETSAEERDARSTSTASPRLGHDFSRIPLTPTPGPRLQRKCACGSHAMTDGECEECSKKKR